MQPTAATEPARENLAGLVERVTFHNEDNGFCVLRVKARGQRDLITVVGHAAAIGAGEFVQASGRWVNDRTHGVQFRADFLRAAPPTTAEGIEKYLASGMIKGIGPIYARKLVKAFREQEIDGNIGAAMAKWVRPTTCRPVRRPTARRLTVTGTVIASDGSPARSGRSRSPCRGRGSVVRTGRDASGRARCCPDTPA